MSFKVLFNPDFTGFPDSKPVRGRDVPFASLETPLMTLLSAMASSATSNPNDQNPWRFGAGFGGGWCFGQSLELADTAEGPVGSNSHPVCWSKNRAQNCGSGLVFPLSPNKLQ